MLNNLAFFDDSVVFACYCLFREEGKGKKIKTKKFNPINSPTVFCVESNRSDIIRANGNASTR